MIKYNTFELYGQYFDLEKERSEQVEEKIEAFLLKNKIHILAAPGGAGKTFLAYALAVHFLKNNYNVVYIDLDNSVDVPHVRGLYNMITDQYKNHFTYLNYKAYDIFLKEKEHKDYTAYGFLKYMLSISEKLDNALIVIDSLQKFISVCDDKETREFFDLLRRYNHTFLILHHFSRINSWVKGSSHILDMADMVYSLKTKITDNIFEYQLKKEKYRYKYEDEFTVFVNVTNYDLGIGKLVIHYEDYKAVKYLADYILKNGRVQQKDLIDFVLKNKYISKQTALEILKKYENLFVFTIEGLKSKMWSVNKDSEEYRYLYPNSESEDESEVGSSDETGNFITFLKQYKSEIDGILQSEAYCRDCRDSDGKLRAYRGVSAILYDIDTWTESDALDFVEWYNKRRKEKDKDV